VLVFVKMDPPNKDENLVAVFIGWVPKWNITKMWNTSDYWRMQ
jgi:hypothetical protein